MKITFDCPDKINGLLTMTIEPADYQEQVEKTLKNYRKKAQVPGFRPGMVPMGMIKKQYGTAVKVDEVNKLMGEKLYAYIQENKIQMLGEPLPNQEKQVPQDFEKDGDMPISRRTKSRCWVSPFPTRRSRYPRTSRRMASSPSCSTSPWLQSSRLS